MKLAPFAERRAAHETWQGQHRSAAERAESLENRISAARLVTFLVAAGAFTSALMGGGVLALATAGLGTGGFIAAVVYQSRVWERRAQSTARSAVHSRHLARMHGEFPGRDASALVPEDHAYARDIDMVGAAGLLARLDVTHTVRGARTLTTWLTTADDLEGAQTRQDAVRELAPLVEWRRELEVAAASRDGNWDRDLDDRPFLHVTRLPSLFAAHRWLRPVIWLMPVATLSGILLAQRFGMSSLYWIVPLVLQLTLLRWARHAISEALNWMTARLQFAQAFEAMLRHVESTPFETPGMRKLQGLLSAEGVTASEQMRRLARIEGWAQLRTQGPVYVVINALTLWDFFCLERMEAFNRQVGPVCERWFETLGQVEALCALATLADIDPTTCFPELCEDGGLRLEGVAHPLIDPGTRIANDVELDGPGSVWVITGSNMAGKSTLLRSVGLGIALALAGGPVVARRARVPALRLRASMRIDDSLQRGASYFRAELNKLQSVVSDLDQSPPVFFLLDEVLRGTNSRARSVGARAVVRHLLARGAFGLVATHDAGLSTLSEEAGLTAYNCHFTDVFERGEMKFDYRLRPGVVQSSNALRLLQMAGIEVDDEVVEAQPT